MAAIARRLQWGRTREGAETPTDKITVFRGAGQLQWGRTREGAETASTAPSTPPTTGFNGAAPVKVRKPDLPPRTTNHGLGFNGAAPVKVRKRIVAGMVAAASVRASMGPHP